MIRVNNFKQKSLEQFESNFDNLIQPELVSFRELIPEITDTKYLTHSTHYYPAKFIPQVVRYYIKKFTKEGDLIIDPFAGSGTVGLEAYICNRNSYLLDINPILNHIMPIKVFKQKRLLETEALLEILNTMEQNGNEYYPDWPNLNYWYPDEFLKVLLRLWGWQKELQKDIYSFIIESALLKVSKHFSYAEHKIPKLFKSKRKKKYIEELRNQDWKNKLIQMIYDISTETLKDVNQFSYLAKNSSANIFYFGGVDSSTFKYNEEVQFDGLVTSPPYLQAQEYIRTSKLELFWLGYKHKYIKELSRLEIPYRKPSRIIKTDTLNDIKSKIKRNDLQKILDSYFSLTIDTLEHAMAKMKKNTITCIFIGNPTIGGLEVEIWRILMEYFTDRNYLFEGVYEDKIKTRQLFGSRNNLNPEGMKSEYLLKLRKLE